MKYNHITDGPPSIIAVQGLGADPYYTWVKKLDLAQQKTSNRFHLSWLFHKFCAPAQELSDAPQTTSDMSEVMWLQDLLPNIIPNARIASYSYESDWRKDVKTNLRNCGEQFLNILHQNRVGDVVSRVMLNMIFLITNKYCIGKAATSYNYWAQSWGLGH